METGTVVVEQIGGKSTVTRCFSKYPLKIIIPYKGDSISCNFRIGNGCVAVLTTQASTKVYKSVGNKYSQQILEVDVGSNALFVNIPDPVTCFSTARYSQRQVFRVFRDSNLVIVDWFTSGRYESGEKWDFGFYKSTNNIYSEYGRPIFLDTVLLEQGNISSISERMQEYQVIAMVILLGPKLRDVQNQVQENVTKMMSGILHTTRSTSGSNMRSNSGSCLSKPDFIASCSAFGPQGAGLTVRVAATTTEAVYEFLRHQLACLEPLIGVSPYH